MSNPNPLEVITLGCRLNMLESEMIRSSVAGDKETQTIVVNSCAVTNEAVRQTRQTIRKAKRKNPDAHIVVTGCAAQVEPASFAEMAEVDLVLGNIEKLQPGQYNFATKSEQQADIRVNDIMSVTETAPHMIDEMDGRARAFVEVQTGCDHRCTFCIIPYGRGNSRSVPMGSITNQINHLVDNGFKEVILTGVDITGYGSDLPGSPTFGQLVKTILRHCPDLERLRLSSIDCVEIDEILREMIATEPRLMPHLHLSLQAGDTMILKRMKRRHTRDDALQCVEQLKNLRPDITFGADLIAGFPTETDEMFENSRKLIHDCHLTHLHVFPFSPKRGTPAARMPQVNGTVIRERAKILREESAMLRTERMKNEIGKTHKVLMEKPGFGRTETDYPVDLGEATSGSIGSIVSARIVSINGDRLIAEAS